MHDTALTGPVLSIRATPAERVAIRSAAASRGVSQSDLIRGALVAAGVPIRASAKQSN
jgi:uncharacterized protein (DUF1778 family)